MSVKVLFFGTAEFTIPILAKIKENFNLIGVVCQPDKRKGRKYQLQPPPAKIWAEKNNISVYQPITLKDEKVIEQIKNFYPDIIVTAAYGKILPKSILDIPPYGCLNIHASLLPKYRGAAPINWAIFNGEKKTGITIILMDEGMDTGPIIIQQKLDILDEDNAITLSKKLSKLGAELLVKILPLWIKKEITPMPQDDTKATYAPLLKKENGLIKWEWDSEKIINHIRAFVPWPGSFTFFRNKKIILEEVENFNKYIVETSLEPGKIIKILKKEGPIVATGNGGVLVKKLKIENKKTILGKDFLNGYRIIPGEKFTDSKVDV